MSCCFHGIRDRDGVFIVWLQTLTLKFVVAVVAVVAGKHCILYTLLYRLH